MKNLTTYLSLWNLWNALPYTDMNTIMELWSTLLYNEYKVDTNRLYGWEESYIPYHMWERDEEAEDDQQFSFCEKVNCAADGLPEFLEKCKNYFEVYNSVDFNKIQPKISKAA